MRRHDRDKSCGSYPKGDEKMLQKFSGWGRRRRRAERGRRSQKGKEKTMTFY